MLVGHGEKRVSVILKASDFYWAVPFSSNMPHALRVTPENRGATYKLCDKHRFIINAHLADRSWNARRNRRPKRYERPCRLCSIALAKMG